MARLANILISISEGIIPKYSYERCDYESVDEKNLRLFSKNDEKKNSGCKGLIGGRM